MNLMTTKKKRERKNKSLYVSSVEKQEREKIVKKIFSTVREEKKMCHERISKRKKNIKEIIGGYFVCFGQFGFLIFYCLENGKKAENEH